MPSHRELFDDNLRNKYLNKGNYHMDQQELTQCETPTVSSARKGKWPVFVLYLIGSRVARVLWNHLRVKWRESGFWSYDLRIYLWCLQAPEEKQASKRKKRRKKNLVVSLGFPILCWILWNSHGSLHVKDWFSYTLTITLVAKLTYSFV